MKLISFLLFILLMSMEAFAQPKLEIIGGNTYDWGKVKPKQSPLKAKVKITNGGTETLIISKVKPTCGCTTAPLDKSELQPGDTATLDISLNVGSSSSRVHKSIRISSNDKQTPTLNYSLKCEVIRDIQLSSKHLNLRDMTIGYEKEGKLKITNSSKNDIVFSDFKTKPDLIKLNFNKDITVKPGESVELIAKVIPEKTGSFRGDITFNTSNDDNKTMHITVWGKVKESPIFNNTK